MTDGALGEFLRHRRERLRPEDVGLPGGGRRLLQEASGYTATIVGGEVTRRHGVDTGARPGRLLRGQR